MNGGDFEVAGSITGTGTVDYLNVGVASGDLSLSGHTVSATSTFTIPASRKLNIPSSVTITAGAAIR